jgi:CubicO group peptidase (beta-lactamase class C family)
MRRSPLPPAVLVPLAGIALLSLSGCGRFDPGRMAGVATGFVSHQMCSATFVSGLDPQVFYREAVAPTTRPLEPLLSHRIDRERGEVTASIAGMAESRAAYRGPLGCLVLQDPPPAPEHIERAPAGAPLLPPIAGPALVEPASPALAVALDRAFEETPAPPHRRTKGIVVVRDGRIVAERYAPGVGIDTPLIGWSATKSVMNALAGILVRQGRLSLHGPAPVAAWSDPKDPRRAISVDNLLRMTSGLALGNSLTAGASDLIDPSSQMLFDERDMAGFAERARLKAAPGTSWAYANGNTLLLSRLVRDKASNGAGGNAAATLAFARRELFDRLGMTNVTLEFDAVGTPVGSSHMLAPARDWARFGMLYLEDGVVGGTRLLPEGWIDYSAAPTPGSETFGYAAGFWTNRGHSAGARHRTRLGLPADSFMARGAFGQYVIVVPSRRLVVARFGISHSHDNDMATVARLVADVIAATDVE